MRRKSSASDYLPHSFTDLMTSLMVIFVLLLLVFLNRQASVQTTMAWSAADDLRRKLGEIGFQRTNILPNDPYTVVFQAPKDSLTFERNEYHLKPAGKRFLKHQVPNLANILCDEKYRRSVESLIVEGYTDNAPYRGLSFEESRNLNLKLSQDRSREVVNQSLSSLDDEEKRECLVEKISASGRGGQDLESTGEERRRVIFKVRLNSSAAVVAVTRIHGTKIAPIEHSPTPAVSKVLSLFDRLRATPREQVDFRLTEEEINEYLLYALTTNPRPGVKSATIKVFPHNYLSLFTVVDFDAVERERPGTIPLVLRPVLRGTQSLWMDIRFHIQDGKATYTVEKAYYQNTKLPLFVVRQVVGAIGALQPESFRTDEPVPLPYGLKNMESRNQVLMGRN